MNSDESTHLEDRLKLITKYKDGLEKENSHMTEKVNEMKKRLADSEKSYTQEVNEAKSQLTEMETSNEELKEKIKSVSGENRTLRREKNTVEEESIRMKRMQESIKLAMSSLETENIN